MNATIHRHMPIAEYLTRPWWTRSKLDLAFASPRRYRRRYVDDPPAPDEQGEDLAIGKHAEALAFGEVSPCVLVNVKSPRTVAWRKAQAEHPHTPILSTDGAAIANACAEAVRACEWWQINVMQAKSLERELVLSWSDERTGLPLAARPDVIADQWCIDMKTCRQRQDRNKSFRDWWGWEARSRGYHRQAAMQVDGASAALGRQLTHVQVVVEKPKPDDPELPEVRLYMLPEEGPPWSLDRGRIEVAERAARALELMSTGAWVEDEFLTPQLLERPGDGEITMGGSPLEGL